MQQHNEHSGHSITKDSESEGPVPAAWRPILNNIVDAFVRQDYCLAKAVPGVAPVPVETAIQISQYIEEYGATLVALPEETWGTSVSIWTGDYWNVLVDLWTEEEGRSDLVLQVHVSETVNGYDITIHMVYVP